MISRFWNRYAISVASPRRFFRSHEYPTAKWRAPLTQEDRVKVTQIYRSRPPVPASTRIPPSLLPTSSHPSSSTPSQQLPLETRQALAKMKMQSLEYTSPVNNLANGLYAIAEVNTKPYSVLLNDIIITKRLPGTRVGDILQLTRVRELGSKDYYVRGSPLVNPKYVNVQAMVLSHTWSAKYTIFRRRLGRGPGDRKFRKRSHRDQLTVLRITNLDVGIGTEEARQVLLQQSSDSVPVPETADQTTKSVQ